ncbi:MAG: glycosyltransferase [Caulobacteraceae bacterium]
MSGVDVEFTLALNNATGKYFTCLDLIDSARDLISDTLYWRLAPEKMPRGLEARVLGRLALEEIELRRKSPAAHRLAPLMSRRRPVVFTDPREVIFHQLKPCDVVLCHDVGPITHAELYHPIVKPTYSLAFSKIQQARPLMLFVSQTSLDAFAELYGRDFPLMRVMHPPMRTGIHDGPEDPVPGAPDRFFLSVGSIGARKNQARAIKAFHKTGLAKQGLGYMICGGPEPGFETVVELADRIPGVFRPGYVTDRQLRWLYRRAIGFVLPSLLEGFGSPAPEAVAYDLVPLVGRGGALHEVAGDGAVLVEPLDVDSIAAGMEHLAHMSIAERQSRLRQLRANTAKFSPAAAFAIWRETLVQAARLSAETGASRREAA